MKSVFKKPVIFSVAMILLLTAALCCCIVSPAQAAGTMPSCHQTAQDNNQTHDSENCDCENSFGIIKTQISPGFNLTFHSAMSIQDFINTLSLISVYVIADNAPPDDIKNPIPLYIQNSILRI